MFKIFYYQKSNGRAPVKEFIDSLTEDDQKIVFENLEFLQTYGFDARILKPFAGVKKLWEARIQIKDKQVRIFVTFQKERIIFLLHGFIKKSQQTPKNEIKTAMKRLKEIT